MDDTIDPKTVYRTAKALAAEVDPQHLDGVRATLQYLHHTSDGMTPERLQSHSPCRFSDRAAEVVVLRLRTEGIITADSLDEGTLHLVFDAAEVFATRDDPPENTIVATLPRDDRAFDAASFEALHERMLALIRSANDRLVLVSPFVSKKAFERLRPALQTAADNGAILTVVTRYLTYENGESMVGHNRGFVHEVLDDELLAPRTNCYEYRNSETWTTFHAKLVLADHHTAYLGTANITATGLGGNLELGVMFRDDTVGRISDLVTDLMSSRYLHKVERDAAGQFRRARARD
jgi:phosphatidylserine/phosphatidylglycerophosphate/cardiolipin synthase-like enzyme